MAGDSPPLPLGGRLARTLPLWAIMVMPRHPESNDPAATGGVPARLNLLLSCREDQSAGRLSQLGCLLEPLGIRSVTARSVEESEALIRAESIHLAVVDWAIPLKADASRGPAAGPAGGRVLQLLRRLDPSPPTVIVRPRQAVNRDHVRSLSEALREGAFAVLDHPIDLETLLETMRRVLRRYYADVWPDAPH